MEFCDECGSMMHSDDGLWICGSCGFEKPRDADSEADMITTEGQDTDSGPVDRSAPPTSPKRGFSPARSATTSGARTTTETGNQARKHSLVIGVKDEGTRRSATLSFSVRTSCTAARRL